MSEEEQTKKLCLGYWDMYGLAQPARYLLEITGTPYEEVRYVNESDWFIRDKFNLSLPFPNLPYLIDGEIKLTEFPVIFEHLIDTYGKPEWHGIGKDIYVVKMLRNIMHGIADAIYYVDLKSNEEKEKFFENAILQKLKFIYEFLGEKTYLLGYFTGADLYFLNVIKFYKASGKPLHRIEQFLDRFNSLEARLQAIPQIDSYIHSDRHVK